MHAGRKHFENGSPRIQIEPQIEVLPAGTTPALSTMLYDTVMLGNKECMLHAFSIRLSSPSICDFKHGVSVATKPTQGVMAHNDKLRVYACCDTTTV